VLVEHLPALFDDRTLYSPRSAATLLRRASGSDRALIGARFLRRLHGQGVLPAIRVGARRLVFTGFDLNRLLERLLETPASPAERGRERAVEVLRREDSL